MPIPNLLTNLIAATLTATQPALPLATTNQPHEITLITSPFLPDAWRKSLEHSLIDFLGSRAPSGCHVAFVDGWRKVQFGEVTVPALRWAGGAPDVRLERMAPELIPVVQWLRKKNISSELTDSGAVDWPGSLQAYGKSTPGPRDLLIIGNPLTISSTETEFNMVHRVPNDPCLFQTRERCPYGIIGSPWLLSNARVTFICPGDIWDSPMFEERVERFIALYLQLQRGKLIGFSGDIKTGLENVLRTDASSIGTQYSIDTSETNAAMVNLQRSIPKTSAAVSPTAVDWEALGFRTTTAQARILAQFEGEAAKTNTAVGIMWGEQIDLDLYVWPDGSREDEYVCYRHQVLPNARHLHDYTSATTADYETVLINPQVPITSIHAWVNFFAGSAPPSGVTGTVMFYYAGKRYLSAFHLVASSGNGGEGIEGRGNSAYWCELHLQEMMQTGETRQASGR